MWHIEHQCPQCGAPITLQEVDNLVICSFCRTRLSLLSGQYTGYCLPIAPSDSADILYIPYWRLKGMVFYSTVTETLTKLIDTNNIAIHLAGMPFSLGVRPQVMKLRFITSQTQGILFKPQVAVADLYQTLEERNNNIKMHQQVLHRSIIAETVRIIFAPIIVRHGKVFDGVLNRFLDSVTETTFDELEQFDHTDALHVTFIPCLCPDCGNDLEGRKESHVLLCRNCNSAWRLTVSGLRKIECHMVAGNRIQEEYLPFWKIDVQVDGIELNSRADLMRVTNAPQRIKSEWEETKVYFWVPAFKISPRHFLRLAQGMTMVQPETAEQPEIPAGSFHPVTLPAEEAAEIIMALLAESALPKKDFFAKRSVISIQVQSVVLVYVPFQSCSNEFINSLMKMGINKNTLRFGSHL